MITSTKLITAQRAFKQDIKSSNDDENNNRSRSLMSLLSDTEVWMTCADLKINGTNIKLPVSLYSEVWSWLSLTMFSFNCPLCFCHQALSPKTCWAFTVFQWDLILKVWQAKKESGVIMTLKTGNWKPEVNHITSGLTCPNSIPVDFSSLLPEELFCF